MKRYLHTLLPVTIAAVGISAWIYIGVNVSEIEDVTQLLSGWHQSRYLPLAVLGSFVIGSVLFVPVWVLYCASACLLEPCWAIPCALLGASIGGLYGLYIGRVFGQTSVARMSPGAHKRLQNVLTENEVFSVAVIRNLPLAPFTAVNMAMGVAGITPLAFALGTMIGALPLILFVNFVSYSATINYTDVSAFELILLTAAVFTFGAIALLAGRIVNKS